MKDRIEDITPPYKSNREKSLKVFYNDNNLYLNESFFGELFNGFVKALASLFGVEIDQVSGGTFTSAGSSFSDRVRDAVEEDGAELPDGVEVDKASEEELSVVLSPEVIKEITKDVVGEILEPAAAEIAKLEGIPAFLKGTETENPEVKEEDFSASGKKVLSEDDNQIEANKAEMTEASKGYGRILGVCRFIKEKHEDFDFTEPPKPATPGDLVQAAAYLANKIEEGGFGAKTEEPEKIISFSEKYSKDNDFSLNLGNASYTPSSDVKGEQGEALASAKEEIKASEKEKEEEIVELPPEDVELIEDEVEDLQDMIDAFLAVDPENEEIVQAELEDIAPEIKIPVEDLKAAIEDPEEMVKIADEEELDVDKLVQGLSKLAQDLDPESEVPEEVAEQGDPTDEIEAAAKEAAAPKDGVTLSLKNWYDSLSQTSQKSLTSKNRMGDLRDGIFSAIDKSVDEVTTEVETAIELWRDENEETLIKSKRFAKKNFDSLQKLVPQMVAFVLKKSNESSGKLLRIEVHRSVRKMLDGVFNKMSNRIISEKKYSISRFLFEQEEEGNPEVDADPTKAIQAAGKQSNSVKSAVTKAMNDWGASLSKTSQETLKTKQRGETLTDLIFTAVDGAGGIVEQEVEKAIQDWRNKHEETLVKSKRFAKKNFDSLQKLVPDMVVAIMKKANESQIKLTREAIRKTVFRKLDKTFIVRQDIILESTRWQKLAGLKK